MGSLALVLLAAALCGAQPWGISRAGWADDATKLFHRIEETHPNPFRLHPRQAWEKAHAELLAAIPGATRPEFIVAVQRFLSLAGDGHTNIIPYSISGPGFAVRFPFSLYWFEEGLFVTHTTSEMRHLAGLRLTAVNGHPAATVARAAGEILSRSNPMWSLRWAPFLISRPGYLHGLGFGSGELEDGETFTFETAEGVARDEHIEPLTSSQNLELLSLFETVARDVQKPRYFDSGRPYSLEVMPERKAIYVLYNRVEQSEDESVGEFAERLLKTIETGDVERLIVDVRNNGGGNNYFVQPLLHAMLRAEKVNRPGGLFVITGRQTFSAAQNFVTRAERETQALIVGEPAAGSPNHYGDATIVELPSAQLSVIVSTLFWQDSDPNDERQWILPDVPVRERFDDLLNGRDAALEAALEYSATSAQSTPPVARWRRSSQQGRWPTPFDP